LGTPGCGKSMLANRLPSILPDLNEKELLEVVKIYSASGKIKSKEKTLKQKPFRSPHHTISYAGIIGGTANAKPGEISLAHNGVLFLDEIPEFSRQVLEALRQPLEDGKVSIARAGSSFTYPAEFMLVASANPCPCGYSNHPTIPCKCNENRKKQYMQKISGPLIDRFDMLIEMIPLTETEILSSKPSEKSAQVKDRIEKALAIQHLRYGHLNARMTVKEIDKHCELNKECLDILKKFYQSKKLTARSIHKVLKVARTIADMQSATSIELSHVLEAMQYRMNINNG